MISLRHSLVAGIATLLVAGGCTSITVPTFPAINIPSLPAINIPSIPPINLPSGLNLPIPTGGTETVPCTLVTAAEVTSIVGAPVTETSSAANECGFYTSSFEIITVSITSGPSIQGIKLIASGGEDLNIGGNPAYYVNFISDQLYVDKGASSLLVQAVAQARKKDILVGIANIAVGRF